MPVDMFKITTDKDSQKYLKSSEFQLRVEVTGTNMKQVTLCSLCNIQSLQTASALTLPTPPSTLCSISFMLSPEWKES